MPRLVFLLGEDTEGPAAMFADLEYGARQQAFRGRLADSGVTTATVTSPAELETAVLQALTALPRPDQQPAPAERSAIAVGSGGCGRSRRGCAGSPAGPSCSPSWRRRCGRGADGGAGGDRDGRDRQDHRGDRVRPPPPRRVRHRLVGAGRGSGVAPGTAGRAGAGPGPHHRHHPGRGGGGPAAGRAGAAGALVAGVRQRRGPPRPVPVPARGARPGADHLPQPGLARDRRHGRGAGVHPGRVDHTAAPAGPRPHRRSRRIGWPTRSGICRWRSSRPGRCWPTPAWPWTSICGCWPSGPTTCWTTTRAGPTRSRWRRPGRWRSTGSPPTTRPRWTC